MTEVSNLSTDIREDRRALIQFKEATRYSVPASQVNASYIRVFVTDVFCYCFAVSE